MNHSSNGTREANPLGNPTRMIVLGFYDGPTEGVIQFGDGGSVYHFKQEGEEVPAAGEIDTRRYCFHPLPADALDRITAAIEPHIAPSWPFWFPIWLFPSPEIQASVDAAIEAILNEAAPAEWLVETATYHTFEDYRAERHPAGSESRR
jgi:hypothetical protein